ncbi:hypothetical protein ACFYUD_19095 [Nocardia tengchongensis]|uniref:hypothetical protein n=1 Tax=Nocardia tengchongensis TaxID=2055889 RepID=UPI0036BB49DB
MTGIDSQRETLKYVLDKSVDWLLASPAADNIVFDTASIENEVKTIRQLRTRVSSSLINVAFLGSFSSGKSFLVGGLQGRLEYTVIRDDDGMESPQYLGLLHSASKATTACPATVVPVDESIDVDASNRGFLRVRFTDDPREWIDIGSSPLPAVIAAYTTTDERAIAEGRHAAHRDRTVAEVELLLSDPKMPAKLFDLPGTESPHAIHDQIANNAWSEADCFLFVTQATRTLSRQDLDLITRLYTHHLSSGKKVLWVMTGIDRAATMTWEGKAEWKDALEQNNAYLRSNFPAKPDRRDTFIGPEGFLPVSPAMEAKGIWERQYGDRARGEKLIAASRMDRLRSALGDIIEAGTGTRHLATVAIEANSMIAHRYRMYAELLESARLPLAQLENERVDLRRRHGQLKDAIESVRDQLESAFRDHIRRVERSFSGLAKALHSELDTEIKAADLTKEKESQRIELHRAKFVQEWMTKSAKRPEMVWNHEFETFVEGTAITVRAVLTDSAPAEAFGAMTSRVDLTQLKIPPSQKYRADTQDFLQRVSGVVGLSTPVIAGVAAAAGILSGGLVVIPAGLTLAAGLTYETLRRRKGRATALEHLRGEWIESLDEVAHSYCRSFLVLAGVRGEEVVSRAVELLSERRDELSRKMILVDTRLSEPDNLDKNKMVEMLEPYCASGRDIVDHLDRLSRPAGQL